MIYKLDLPKPSEQLIEMIQYHAQQSTINKDTVHWHQQIQNDENINCAYGDFFAKPDVTALAIKEFQPYFNKELGPLIAVITNPDKSRPASYPPHTDRVRTIAINYYIDLGGDNVETVLYSNYVSPDEKFGGKVLPYREAIVDKKYKFSTGEWYAMNSRQYHSVENIETTRCILTLSILATDFSYLTNLVSCTGIEPV